jgi:hypothetical protein
MNKRYGVVLAVATVLVLLGLGIYLFQSKPQKKRVGETPKAGQGLTNGTAAGPSGATIEDQALKGNPCRFTVTKEVEATLQAKLDLSGVENTCSFDPKDNSSRGVKYSLDRYNESVYASLANGAEPVTGVGEKAASSNLNPGASLTIKNGNLLVMVTTGGSGFSDYNFARQAAIAVAQQILGRL